MKIRIARDCGAVGVIAVTIGVAGRRSIENWYWYAFLQGDDAAQLPVPQSALQ